MSDIQVITMSHLFQVLTVFPEMIVQMCSYGVLGQAQKKGILKIEALSLRDFTKDKHRSVDDRPFGGGDGMVLLAEPLQRAIESVTHNKKIHVVYLSPQGKPLDHKICQKLAKIENILLICGRYGGIDQRIINHFVDEEISIGDYVISGGELAAGVFIDAVGRHIPGVLGHEESASEDSFATGSLEAPSFTRPQEFLNQKVPDVLLSGNHKSIQKWREMVSRLVTLAKRKDLMSSRGASFIELKKFWLSLSISERKVLGLSDLKEEDFE